MRSTFKVLFYLKKNKSKEQKIAPVMGRITINGTISQFSAKISVPVHLWDVSANRVKGKSAEADRLNRHLDNIRSQINRHYQSLSDKGAYISAEVVKNSFLCIKKYKMLLELLADYDTELKKRIGIDRDYNTWHRYHRSITLLRMFLKKCYRVSDMPLEEVELPLVEKYVAYLQYDRALCSSTIKGYLTCLRVILAMAFKKGWVSRLVTAGYKYRVTYPPRAYLTEEEIRKVMRMNFRFESQERTRDKFIFACFTGLSHCDMRSLTHDNFSEDTQGNVWIRGHRNKTGGEYTLKLLPVALQIYKKFKAMSDTGKVFPMGGNSITNVTVRRIIELAGIDKRITFHCARHTFATTITLMNGVSIETVSKMLGHKHISTTQIYAKTTEKMIDSAMTLLEARIGERYAV